MFLIIDALQQQELVGAIVEIQGGHDSLDIVEGGGGCMDEEKKLNFYRGRELKSNKF